MIYSQLIGGRNSQDIAAGQYRTEAVSVVNDNTVSMVAVSMVVEYPSGSGGLLLDIKVPGLSQPLCTKLPASGLGFETGTNRSVVPVKFEMAPGQAVIVDVRNGPTAIAAAGIRVSINCEYEG